MIRAVTFPVSSPVGRSWAELDPVLAKCFRLATFAANWAAQTLYRRDTVGLEKTPDAVKQGSVAQGRCYLYGLAQAEPWFKDWDGSKINLNICLRTVHRKYLESRYDVMVRSQQSLLTYKFPFPFPVDATAWKPGYTKEEGQPSGSVFPTVRITLPGDETFVLRLARRSDLARQLARFRELVATPDVRCEAALYWVKTAVKKQLMLKLVGDFPAPPARPKPTHACLLRTDPQAFLVAEIDGRSPWILNCDHVRRLQAVHKAFLQRTGEDRKREKRMDDEQQNNLAKAVTMRCRKHADRIDHFLGQVTTQIAQFCERQKVGVVVFDDRVRTYIPDGFPWFNLGTKLKYKLDALKVPVVDATTPAPEELAAWLTDRSLVRATALAGSRLVRGMRKPKSHPSVTPSRPSPSRSRKTKPEKPSSPT